MATLAPDPLAQRPENFPLAATLWMGAVVCIVAMSACVHGLAGAVPLGQIIFWRALCALIPICGYMVVCGDFPVAMRTKRIKAHLTRGLFGASSMALSFLSLSYLPVANAKAIGYLTPVLVLPFAAWLLRERISFLFVVAVLTGLAGTAIMLASALGLPSEGAIFGVLAGLGYAMTMGFVRVHIKGMTAYERPATIAFYFALICTCLGALTFPFGWITPTLGQLGWLVATGLLGGTAHILSTEATARARISRLAPLDYTGLIWALLFDLLIFGTRPDPLAILGGLIIIAAALVAARSTR